VEATSTNNTCNTNIKINKKEKQLSEEIIVLHDLNKKTD